MDATEVLLDERASLPIQGGPDLPLRLRNAFDTYADLVESISASDTLSRRFRCELETIRELGRDLVEVLETCLGLQPHLAFDRLDQALRRVARHVARIRSGQVGAETLKGWYRARTFTKGTPSHRGNLFHIPFETRHMVTRQRFSVPGVPALYMSKSIYGCLRELHVLDTRHIWASHLRFFALSSPIRVFDMGYKPAHIGGLVSETGSAAADLRLQDFATAYATMWPLIAACTAKRHAPNDAPFVIEYVIPQLFTTWAISQTGNEAIHAIRYFSTQDGFAESMLLGMNLVVPARTRPAQGYCSQLRQDWWMTDPASFHDAPKLTTRAEFSRFEGESILIGQTITPYSQTPYASFEATMESLNLHEASAQ